MCVDGCAIGLRARSGELLKKPWRAFPNDQHMLTVLRGLKCRNIGIVLMDHVHAECRGVDCQEFEKYMFSLIRKEVPRAFCKSTHPNVQCTVPICTSAACNTYELCSSSCDDPSCMCMVQLAERESATNHIVGHFRAVVAMKLSSRT